MKPSKTLIALMTLACTFFFTSCQASNCNCESNSEVIIQNKKLYNEAYVHNERLSDYLFKRYDLNYLERFSKENYRLLVDELLDDKHYVYKITRSRDTFLFTEEIYEDQGLCYSRLMIDGQKILNKKEVDDFTGVIQESCIQNIPLDIEEDDDYLDGSLWILELCNVDNCENIKYVSAVRNSPNESDFLKIAEVIMGFAQLKTK